MKLRFDILYPIISELLGLDLINIQRQKNSLIVHVYTGSIVRVLTILRDHQKCAFRQLVDIVAVDWAQQHTLRFELIYHLLSHTHNTRIQVKIFTEIEQFVPTITNIFPSANWYEREVWDMFGIYFSDHPDLRRILTDYNFVGHPLRKDFPLSGYSEVYYDQKEERVAYKPLDLPIPHRHFNFLSPWEGNWEQLLDQEKDTHK